MMAAGPVAAPLAPALSSAGAPAAVGPAGATTATPSLGQTGNTVNPRIQFLQDLAQVLRDFSSAEILIALMLSRASGRNRDDEEGSSAGFAFLAGAAMAGLLYQQLGQLDQLGAAGSYGAGDVSPVGANLNLTA